MAFNQGPEPAIVLDQNGIRYVDPNPTDQIVNHEDLVMYVKFVARTKGRSILTVSDEETKIDIEQKFVRSNTNFTYPDGKKQIDTDWTNLGGGPLDPGEDIGTFGITNINIDFKSSFMPKIVIDFVDVRGATLFEQGPCSPYSAFFHLPYPVFELTVKGYYGKPVKYTLALIKFTTKFNAETGNFESKGEFIGYTYAFLADIPMGYIMASTYMKQGKDIFPNIWQRYRSIEGIKDSLDGIPEKPMSLYDLIKSAKKLESETPKLKNTFEIIKLAQWGKIKNALTKLRTEIIEIESEWLKVTVGKSKNAGIKKSGNNQKHLLYAKIKNTPTPNESVLINSLYDGKLSKKKGVIFPYLGDGTQASFDASKIGSILTTVKAVYDTSNDLGAEPPKLPLQNIKDNIKGFWGVSPKNNNGISEYSLDVYEALLKEVDAKLKETDQSFKKNRDNVKDLLNQKVREILGFNPSIRNVFAIILANCEVFLEILRKTTIEAETHHETNFEDIMNTIRGANANILDLKDSTVSGNGAQESDETVKARNNERLYPWPTYYQKTSVSSKDSPGDKETYPGENIEFTAWPEVQFVEDFVKALTEMKEDLVLLEGDFEDLPGFDNFTPLNVLETPILGTNEASCRWLNVGRGSEAIVPGGKPVSGEENIYTTIGENAFLVGDYSFINTLTLWKSQLGFENGWGFETLTNGDGDDNGYTSKSVDPDNFLLGPQRIADNPTVDVTVPNLGRYGGDGMPFDGKADELGHQATKISPTTKEVMKKYGYIDALNCLATLSGEDDLDSLALLKQESKINTSENGYESIKQKIKKVLKERWGEKYKSQTFDQWSITTTEAIGGDKLLVTKQNLWDAHYSYVKTNNVLTLTGPIPNSVSEANSDSEYSFHSNPYKNSKSGAALIDKAEIESLRTINLNEDTLQTSLIKGFNENYGTNTEASAETTETDENTTKANKSTTAFEKVLNRNLIEKRPKPSTDKNYYPYDGQAKEEKSKNALTINDQTRLFEVTHSKLYYKSYQDPTPASNKNGMFFDSESQIIWDLGSSRSVYATYYVPSWNDFIGTGSQNRSGGAYDPYVQTPLWTLNYPIYKAPMHANSDIMCTWEIVNKDTNKTAEDLVEFNAGLGYKANGLEGPENADERWANNYYYNYTRNFATWWGINSWGTKQGNVDDEDYVLPLAYIMILSMGFDLYTQKDMMLGHYFPNDGANFKQQSPFSVFSQHPGIFNLPRSFILLVGAILWRAKEGGTLRWDGLDPKRPFKGWNSNSLDGQSVGIDDLSDPVWFFHNCISKPWQLGGAVVSNNLGKDGTKNKVHTGNYLRQYVGERNEEGHYIDVWTESGGNRWGTPPNFGTATQSGFNLDLNGAYIIGSPVVANTDYKLVYTDAGGISSPTTNGFETSYYDNQTGSGFQGWVKSHQPKKQWEESSKAQLDNPISRGMFDQCRQDQIPFLVPQFIKDDFYPNFKSKTTKALQPLRQRKYYEPATLVITDLQEPTNRKAYFGVPSPTASATENYNTKAPNRDKENLYVKLKENCKELMFLPKALKESFIDYFEDWAKNNHKTEKNNEDLKYLNTLDPLNWDPTYGLGNNIATFGKLLENPVGTQGEQGERGFWPYSSNIIDRGLGGFVNPDWRKIVLNEPYKVDDEGNNIDRSGWFYGEDVINTWKQTYSTDSNPFRLSPFQSNVVNPPVGASGQGANK